MFGIGKGFLGGLLGVFFASIIVFFVIYLLVPEVSLKFFGISINSDKYIEETVEKSLAEADLPAGVADDITSYLNSDEGEAFISNMQEAAGGAAESVIAFVSRASCMKPEILSPLALEVSVISSARTSLRLRKSKP